MCIRDRYQYQDFDDMFKHYQQLINQCKVQFDNYVTGKYNICLLYTSPSPRDMRRSRMPSSA
ncbi:hypothetical protein JMUB7533_26730 [Staphylococcus aureus]